MIHMGFFNSSKGKDHSLLFKGNKNVKSKEKQIVKKPNTESEDDSSKPTDEDSVKKVRRKGEHPSFFIAERVFIQRISVSRRIWTSCLSFLRSTISKFQKN